MKTKKKAPRVFLVSFKLIDSDDKPFTVEEIKEAIRSSHGGDPCLSLKNIKVEVENSR